ncbi:MAG TPA: phosphatase PAP2 family protein [Nitrospirae bacterium]|nr:lipid A 1-phosphatase [bacterium BMS3Abin06]GBE33348.1 lipid A 1-phosphatase [bacterium BMS3Bbin05]HDH11302.1 phosphatase PAP2 family protein [Nitrospirota bacterium]HDL20381.1 phosphatase PAP2 family protein [Nitrospirota bacterium]HDZ00503.1 phosphatase PAP2 family protein [Nitrospirota bacterium]
MLNRYTIQVLLAVFILFFNNTVSAEDNIKRAGDILQILLPAAAMGMTYIKGDEQGRKQFYKSFTATMAVTYALKLGVPDMRPDGSDNKSFVSGHTSAAFSGASFIQRRYGWKPGIPAYAAAAFVGWSRIEAKKHYIDDVARGAAIGILSTYIFTSPYKGVTITPVTGEDTYGISLQMNW